MSATVELLHKPCHHCYSSTVPSETMSTSDIWSEKDLKSRISSLLQQETTSDVVFLVGETREIFHCHRPILSSGSPVFQAMFYGNFPQSKEVIVTDVTHSGFRIMLQYLYTDAININSESEALETAFASKKYLVKVLFKSCEKYLLSKSIITLKTVFKLLEESTFLDMTVLKKRCLHFIARNAKRIFSSKSHVFTTKAAMMEILELGMMSVNSEAEVVEAVWEWGSQQCKENDECSTEENIRSYASEFVKMIRFHSMKVEELKPLLEKYPLLDISNELSLLWTLVMQKENSVINSKQFSTVTLSRALSSCPRILLPTEYRYEGNLTSFSTSKQRTVMNVTVKGPALTIIGFEIPFKIIPCYSTMDRRLNVQILVTNQTSNTSSSITNLFTDLESKDLNSVEDLLLNEFVVVEEGDSATIEIVSSSEGVRLPKCLKKELDFAVGKLNVSFEILSDGEMLTTLPIKNVLCFSH